MLATAEGKGTHGKRGVIPHVVNVNIQEKPVLYHPLFGAYCHSSRFLTSKLLSLRLQCLTQPGPQLVPRGTFSSMG